MLVRDILAHHYAQIQGITTIKKYAPRIILDAQLPLITLFADELEAVEHTGTSTTKYRILRAVLFVESVNMGTATSAYDKTDPFFDRVEEYFEARPTLSLADGTTTLQHEYMNDTGETVTPYPTGVDKLGQFWAITFKHRFTIVKPVIFQPGA